MANWITISAKGDGFAGVKSIFQYVNDDGRDPNNVCGQAACATLLTYCDLLPPHPDSLHKIEDSHPADLLGGKFGTTPWRVAATLSDYGVPTPQPVRTVDDLCEWVGRSCPVICVIQNDPRWFGIRGGAHWFVVFGFDDAGVYVTNFGDSFMSWDDFEARWSSAVPWLASLMFKGVTCDLRGVPTPEPVILTP
jgi:hypothetical protein